MLSLKIGRGPEWIALLGGRIRLLVAPMTSAVMMAVKSDLAGKVKALPKAGDAEDGTPPAEGLINEWHVALVKAIVARTILEWEGIGDADGNPVGVTPAGIDALMDLHRVFAEFDAQVVAPYLAVQAEKKGSSPLPSGTSEGATDIAAPATASAPSAPAS